MTYFHIGSVTISSVWIAVIASLLVSSLLFRFISGEQTGDWYINSFFLYLFIWKFSYILLNPVFFLDMPLSVLYFDGGSAGHIIALTAVTILILIKKRNTQGQAVVLLPLFFICYQVLSSAFDRNQSEMLLHFLLLAILLFLLWKTGNNLLAYASAFILFLFLGELLIFSLDGSIFSIEILTLIWLGITTLVDRASCAS